MDHPLLGEGRPRVGAGRATQGDADNPLLGRAPAIGRALEQEGNAVRSVIGLVGVPAVRPRVSRVAREHLARRVRGLEVRVGDRVGWNRFYPCPGAFPYDGTALDLRSQPVGLPVI